MLTEASQVAADKLGVKKFSELEYKLGQSSIKYPVISRDIRVL